MPFCHAALTSVTTAEQQLHRGNALITGKYRSFFAVCATLCYSFLAKKKFNFADEKAVANGRTDSFLREKKP
jgi:hypothetical protein